MVAPHLEPAKVAAELEKLNVVAEIDWYPATPHLLGLNVLLNKSGGVAALDRADSLYRVGATSEEVVRHLAREFGAEVRLGDVTDNQIPAGATFPDVGQAARTIRAVEITSMPMSSVPFCAAAEGRSLGCLNLPNGQRAVFYELSSDDFVEGAMVTQTPAVGFYVSDDDAKLIAVLDRGEAAPESLAIHSWTMRTMIVAGAVPLDDNLQLEQRVRADLGHLENPRRVAELVDGADGEALEDAFTVTGREGVIEAMRALGVPVELASYLYGHFDLEDVSNAQVFYKPGWREALGSGLDIFMDKEHDEHSGLVSAYRRTYLDHPWLGRGLALGEATIGAALTATAAAAGSKRNAWHKVGGVLGSVLLADSVIQVSISTYLGQRLRKHRAATVGDVDEG